MTLSQEDITNWLKSMGWRLSQQRNDPEDHDCTMWRSGMHFSYHGRATRYDTFMGCLRQLLISTPYMAMAFALWATKEADR